MQNIIIFAMVTVHANWSTVEEYVMAIWIVLTGYKKEKLFKMIQSDAILKIIKNYCRSDETKCGDGERRNFRQSRLHSSKERKYVRHF